MHGLAKAIKADFKAAQSKRGLSARMVSVSYDHSPTSSWAYQLFDGEVSFSLAMVQMWHSLTGAQNFMRWIGDLCEHVVAPKPCAKHTTHTIKSLQAFTNYLIEVDKAKEDGKYTKQEAVNIELRGKDLMSAILGEIEYYKAEAEKCPSSHSESIREAS